MSVDIIEEIPALAQRGRIFSDIEAFLRNSSLNKILEGGASAVGGGAGGSAPAPTSAGGMPLPQVFIDPVERNAANAYGGAAGARMSPPLNAIFTGGLPFKPNKTSAYLTSLTPLAQPIIRGLLGGVINNQNPSITGAKSVDDLLSILGAKAGHYGREKVTQAGKTLYDLLFGETTREGVPGSIDQNNVYRTGSATGVPYVPGDAVDISQRDEQSRKASAAKRTTMEGPGSEYNQRRTQQANQRRTATADQIMRGVDPMTGRAIYTDPVTKSAQDDIEARRAAQDSGAYGVAAGGNELGTVRHGIGTGTGVQVSGAAGLPGGNVSFGMGDAPVTARDQVGQINTATDEYNLNTISALLNQQQQTNEASGGGFSFPIGDLTGLLTGSFAGDDYQSPTGINSVISPEQYSQVLQNYVTAPPPPPPTSSQPPPTTTPPPGSGTTTPPPQSSRNPEAAYTQEQIADWDSWWQHSTQNVPNTTEGDAFKQTILNSSGNPLPGYDPKYWDDWNSPQDTFGNYYQGSPGFGGSINGSTTPLFSRDDPDFASYGTVHNPYTVLDLARITGKLPSEIAKLPVSERFRLAKEVYKLENPPNTPQYTPQLPTLRSGDLYNKYAPSTNNNIGSVITGLTNLFPDSSQPNQSVNPMSASVARPQMNQQALMALLAGRG